MATVPRPDCSWPLDGSRLQRALTVLANSRDKRIGAPPQENRAMTPTPPDNAVAAMALLTAIAIALVLAADWLANLLR
jgi:hypothetical protein